MSVFTEAPQVIAIADAIKTETAGRMFSDIVDNNGHQYVDFVMEGGGVLGVSLLGYAYGLEQAGLRFRGIGGTSAGSVVAMMLAALGRSDNAKAARAVDLLAEMPMEEFMDGGRDSVRFTNAVVKKEPLLMLLGKALPCVHEFTHDLGLHPGKVFEEWLKNILKQQNVTTIAELQTMLAERPPELRMVDGSELPAGSHGRLVIISADVSTETKVDFPRMASLYWNNSENVNPARLVRASMSIPFFFHPVRLPLPQGPEAGERWSQLAGYTNTLPLEAVLVDGGIMSNFPINVFHTSDAKPRAPTFGAKIGFDRIAREANSLKTLLSAVFDSARHTLDYDFIVQHPDYKHLVSNIDIENDHNWLNFAMKLEEKIQLFTIGMQTARVFLKKFNWPDYQKMRESLATAYELSNKLKKSAEAN